MDTKSPGARVTSSSGASAVFHNAGFTDADLRRLLDELEQTPARRLEKLILSHNAITDRGGARLAAFLADSAHLAPRLRVVNAMENSLSAVGVRAVATAACGLGATRTLVAINLKGNVVPRVRHELQQCEQPLDAATQAALEALGKQLVLNRAAAAETRQAQLAAQRAAKAKAAARVATLAAAMAAAPPIAVVGGGIAGLATALALARRGYRAVVFERDRSFDERAQGYGLTMQQGTRACRTLGIEKAVAAASAWSSRHFVFDPAGNVVAFWGPTHTGGAKAGKRRCSASRPGDTGWRRVAGHNLHIPRQALRHALLAACLARTSPPVRIEWGSEFSHFAAVKDGLALCFTTRRGRKRSADGCAQSTAAATSTPMTRTVLAPAAVFCDGIHSRGRKQLVGDPLVYLGLIVMLGIFDVDVEETDGGSSDEGNCELLHERIFQTSDGATRLFVMPFALAPTRQSMWQLTFAASEEDARRLSAGGPEVLRAEALRRCGTWHAPIPAMIARTKTTMLTGYPVYDRLPPNTTAAELAAAVAHGTAESQQRVVVQQQVQVVGKGAGTAGGGEDGHGSFGSAAAQAKDGLGASDGRELVVLAGDASHCMSPLKGQGANQALLDSIVIADELDRALRNPAAAATGEDEEDGDNASMVRRCVAKAWRRAAVAIGKRTRSKVLHSRAACAVLHHPNFLSPEFQVRRKMGTGKSEHARVEEVLARIAAMRREGVGAMQAGSGRLDAFAFGDRFSRKDKKVPPQRLLLSVDSSS